MHLLLGIRVGSGVLGDGLGTLRNSVLGELSREDEADGSLDFARSDGLTLVGASKATGLNGDTLEDIIDEGIHNVHSALRNSSIVVNLLQNLVDEGTIRVIVSLAARGISGLLGDSGGLLDGSLLSGGLGGRSLLGGFSSLSTRGHDDVDECWTQR